VPVLPGLSSTPTIPKQPISSAVPADMSMSESDALGTASDTADIEMHDASPTPEPIPQMPTIISKPPDKSPDGTQTAVEPTPPLDPAVSPSLSPPDMAHVTPMEIDSSSVTLDVKDEDWHVALPISSLEHVRAWKAATFDPSELDSLLYDSPKFAYDAQPTPKELLETQTWDDINPRTTWPELLSGSWIEDKRKEIKARGGRKKNFGKVLTEQVLQEKKENGWSIWQGRDTMVMNEERKEIMRGVDDLFGLKGAEEMVPAVRNGVLFMVGKEDGEGGKRGRPKSSSRIFQVG
jgi:hypothetical protein